MNMLGNWFRRRGQDKVVIAALILCTLACALLLPVDLYPRDVWLETQYLLFGRFPGAENYTPIAAPTVLYKIVHWLAPLLQLELKGEMYLASLMQNGLVFLSACLLYYTCKQVSQPRVAAYVAIASLLAVPATGRREQHAPVLLGGMLLSNDLRFGRPELTNSDRASRSMAHAGIRSFD